MPLYALVCRSCGRKLAEVAMSISERGEARCPGRKCGGELENDYTRHSTATFTLKGNGWPSKAMRIEKAMLKGGD
jgi:predicted nucleic acid-binding Zn ribbon protein